MHEACDAEHARLMQLPSHCSQARTIMGTSLPNPLYEKGFRGYSMLTKDGSDYTVKFNQVGKLAASIHTRLLPLLQGPFGSGENEVPAKVLSKITLEIHDGPLDVVEYATIEEFKAAIDALPDPEDKTAQPATDEFQAHVRESFNDLYQRVEALQTAVFGVYPASAPRM